MPSIKRKTKKVISKQVKKLVRKHGPEVALDLATTLVGSVVADAGKTQSESKPKKAAGKKTDKPKKKTTGDQAKADKSSKKAKK